VSAHHEVRGRIFIIIPLQIGLTVDIASAECAPSSQLKTRSYAYQPDAKPGCAKFGFCAIIQNSCRSRSLACWEIDGTKGLEPQTTRVSVFQRRLAAQRILIDRVGTRRGDGKIGQIPFDPIESPGRVEITFQQLVPVGFAKIKFRVESEHLFQRPVKTTQRFLLPGPGRSE